jgi:hypothetical protein
MSGTVDAKVSGRLAYEVRKEDGLLARLPEGPKYKGS